MSGYFKRSALTDGQRSWNQFPAILKNLEQLREQGFTFRVGKRPNRRGVDTMLRKACAIALTESYMHADLYPRLSWVEFGITCGEAEVMAVDKAVFDAATVETECERLARLIWGPTLLMFATKRFDGGLDARGIVAHIRYASKATPDVIFSTLSDENLCCVLEELFLV